MNRSVCGARAALAGLLPAGAAGSASAESEWLAMAICSQCVSPTIFAKSGIGTANARAAADGAPKPLDYSCAWRASAATAGKVVRKGLVADQQGKPERHSSGKNNNNAQPIRFRECAA